MGYAPDGYGQVSVGIYNCLPPDRQVGYNAPEEIYLKRAPKVEFFRAGPTFRASFDYSVTKSQIEAEFPLSEAYKKFGIDDSQVARVHENWTEWAIGTPERLKTAACWAAPYGPVALMSVANAESGHFAGKRVAVAPFICGSTPFEGVQNKSYVDEASISVTDSTTEGWEFGLAAEAGMEKDGTSVKQTASFRWSKSTTHTTEVRKSHTESTTIPGREGQWTKLDMRACAGVYSGWLRYLSGGEYGLYPMRAPVQAPGFPNPVAEHQLHAPADTYSDAEATLLRDYHQAEDDYAKALQDTITAGPSDSDRGIFDGVNLHLMNADAERRRLQAAIDALGI
ncbi:hypothetical protein [Streptomyces malaysiense]|uniref:Uncharacterized protein n=1 Tax=Streptomyces malaysiense TaxID=1428626 RepID=A0A1J4PRQ4_9ACTN|nr:hypothetical protein [Streptomyces malaysiense]OIK23579.1 hypothetical protein VT52_031870 [Streptomyces malaysiense]